MAAPAGAGSNRRLFIILGVGAALILANFVLPKVLFKSDEETPFVPPRVTQPGGSGGESAAPGEAPPPETFEVFSTKNPFTPVVSTGGFPEPIPPDEEDPFSTTTTTFPTGGSTTSTSFPSSFGSTTTTLPTSTEPRTPQQVEMLELFTDTNGEVVAQVRVDSVVYKVGEGDVFATSYQVVSLSLAEQCGEFLFGDDRFTLCVGEELLK
jgi:hypothetical protein